MSLRAVGVRVVDARTGKPVPGATIRSTLLRTRDSLPRGATETTPGDYLVAEDGTIPGLTRAGERLRITASLGSRRVSARYVLGLDAGGCHVELRGPKELRLP
ncbi:MAG: hypothetical protein MUE41_10840 [Gemmatimonadaceae bacterium]|nr:hypothetical protein [Gemmatimonadaceae bacterium]